MTSLIPAELGIESFYGSIEWHCLRVEGEGEVARREALQRA
jgi:hypothetical protein